MGPDTESGRNKHEKEIKVSSLKTINPNELSGLNWQLNEDRTVAYFSLPSGTTFYIKKTDEKEYCLVMNYNEDGPPSGETFASADFKCRCIIRTTVQQKADEWEQLRIRIHGCLDYLETLKH